MHSDLIDKNSERIKFKSFWKEEKMILDFKIISQTAYYSEA